jgi:hypothetical protein
MSLEAAIESLTEVIRKNNELLSTLVAKANANLKDKVDAKPARGNDDGGDDNGDDGVGEKEAPRRGRGRPPGSKNKEKAPSIDEMKLKATSFLEDATDDSDYDERREALKKLTARFKAAKFSEIPENQRQDALDELREIAENWGKEEPPRRRRSEEDDDV